MIPYCLIIAIACHCGMTIDVLALSSSPSPSSSSHPKSAQRDKNLETLKQVVNVIQNPELYSTSWLNFVDLIEDPEHDDDSSVRRRHRDDGDSDGKQDRRFLRPIASCDVTKGQIIALHPVQDISFQKREKLNRKQRQKRRRELLHDDLKISIEVNLLEEEKYPYPCIRQGWIYDDDNDDSNNNKIEKETRNIFIHSDDKFHPGWYGNLIPTARTEKSTAAAAAAVANRHQSHNNTSVAGNCILVPLPGAAPFCVFVATRDIAQGDLIEKKKEEKQYFDNGNADNDNDRGAENNRDMLYYVQSIAKEYANEIGELISFLDMACAPSSSLASSSSSSSSLLFHSINESYPKLEKIHSSPDIYSIQDFLSESECERIVKKVSSNNGINMRPCLIKNEATGIVEPDLTRTSLNANIARREVPTIIQKILNLMNNDNDNDNNKNTTNSCGTSIINEEQIEILQVLRYRNGQEFKSHTDGFNGPTTACGFYQSGRIATIFCYLNNVTDSGGGKTTFPLLTDDGRSSSLDITPKRGLAVVHFPTSLDLKEDERTEHIGNPVNDMEEKWILTVWVWKNQRADMRYSEDALPFLSDDII
jgi:hypothetical protein